ncbi:ribosomal protection-like ABC-F family protein [Cohnella thailandensis]|uniref:ABC-F family ATP-binding cassette domain-containing protein n=1 Tax=Cohnella thailandensis TaxID=557557 RepID=A0A841T9A9_9BACL|nr:ABC-F family ATP-binding cassette domain-containing protein [Cohnella thailandensis]MBB6638437.1 ABC-F family ATP-binding cassette domain-containing protein [Cohnella thailandensis]MBP1977085.1 ATPase subunit of ABC transporter with duplicated ATPase domains [Cohnella thailandensis]
MIIANVQQLRKYHSANLILDGATFQIQEQEKVALIGRNGSGKSTLLRILSGYDQPDGGSVSIKKDLRIGYLPQIPAEFERMTLYEVLAHGFNDLSQLKQKMSELELRMASPEAAERPELMGSLLAEYTDVQERFEQGGGYEMDTSIDQVASGLQIAREDDSRPFRSLSGGEKSRVVLASQLVTRPGLLLLDEPTNHLDMAGIEWLEQFVQRYDGACVIVSHDRYFLDAVCGKTIELEDGEAHLYHASYSGYVKEKEERLLRQFELYQEQQKNIKKMKETIRQLEEWGRVGGNEKFFKRAASIRKALDRMEKVKRPALERKSADFAINPLDRSGNRVIEIEGIAKRFEDRVILKDAEGVLFYGENVALVGDNGSGKTTLFKLLLGELAPDSGQIKHGSRVDIGYLAQQEPIQDPKRTVLDYFRKEGGLEEGEARGVLAQYLFYGADVFKSLQSLSGGEWTRLRLALLVRRKPNLLLLDEPTNHLDIDSREALEEALEDYPGTVLAISHDRYFINRLAKRVWELKEGALTAYLGNYDEYLAGRQKPQSTKSDPTRMIKKEPAKSERKPVRGETGDLTAEKLEHEIRFIEEELKRLDAELNGLSGIGNEADLEALWQRRVKLQARLEEHMERWLELED